MPLATIRPMPTQAQTEHLAPDHHAEQAGEDDCGVGQAGRDDRFAALGRRASSELRERGESTDPDEKQSAVQVDRMELVEQHPRCAAERGEEREV